MNINKRPTQNPHESGDADDSFHRSSLNSPLNVTVIATTEKGTTAALNEARMLAKDLNAHITLLKMEVVPPRFPLDNPPVSLDIATKQQCLLVLQSSAREQDVTVRTCLCRDRIFSLRRIFRRRALIVIGGRRHWWLSREERLEKALRGMGHHVIFIEVGSETDQPPQCRFPIGPGNRSIPEDSEITRRTSQSAVRRRGGKKTQIQTVDVCESKFQSIPLCAVDAHNSTLQSGSSLPKDGVHEA
jgi:hypothetical protein